MEIPCSNDPSFEPLMVLQLSKLSEWVLEHIEKLAVKHEPKLQQSDRLGWNKEALINANPLTSGLHLGIVII